MTKSLLVYFFVGFLWAPAGIAQQAEHEIKQMPARIGAYADTEMLLGHAFAGRRLVVVGEHGVVLLSDDKGKTFRQAKSVPTRVTLNAVCFVDDRNGWAVGHWGTIVTTSDAGETWTLRRTDTSTDRPLFAVGCGDIQHVVASGLWSLLLKTQDGGKTWNEIRLQAPPDSRKADRNLLGMFLSGKSIYITAERGMVLRSDDFGDHWTYLDTGYKGSFWTGLALKDGTLLVGGLRGIVYRSTDNGKSWRAVDSETKSSITGIVETKDGLVAVGLGGTVLKSSDGGQSFSAFHRPDRLAFTSVIVVDGVASLGLSKHGVVRELLSSSN